MAAEPIDLEHLPEPGMAVEITTMRRRHVRGVLQIEQQVYPRPWSMSLFLSELAQRTSRVYLVAKVGTTVVGYAGLMLVGSDGHITTIAVDPAWHRRGIGARLLLELSRIGIASGCTALTLEVRMSNDAARRLYEGLGFSVEGVRRDYYQDPREDAIILWKRDLQAERSSGRA
jgi:ribosomal-protein-alanine N-acetyltransferase